MKTFFVGELEERKSKLEALRAQRGEFVEDTAPTRPNANPCDPG